MQVIEISQPGGPEVLKLAERPRPEPAEGEVVIDVAAAGLNRTDVLQRLGKYPPPPGVTDIPGLEVAGVVSEVGAGVERWRAGDRVCALVAGGGYAEACLAPAVQCLPVPQGVTLTDAAALPEACFTVWANVFERGALAAGETLLVHGGSGGIGTTAIQLAAARDARVFATAGTEEKRRSCETLGAQATFAVEDAELVREIREASAGRGVDVVLDMLGGSLTQTNLDVLAPGGRLVLIAFLEGARVTLNLRPILERALTITGSTLRPRRLAEKGRLAAAVEAQVWPLVAEGRIRPQIAATFPLEQAADAHRFLEARRHFGKIILTTPLRASD